MRKVKYKLQSARESRPTSRPQCVIVTINTKTFPDYRVR